MDISAKKEEFSKAYVKSLAAQVGLSHSEPSVDDDSVDISLSGSGFAGLIRNPCIDIQLKCTSQDLIADGVLKYPLKLKNYEDLRGENVIAPRFLMVLVVPDSTDDWTKYENDSLILHNTCYWASLRFAPETRNTSSVTVEIPVEQVLTSQTLEALLENTSKGEHS